MYHFIGIKGSGMASLACILKDLGYDVQGSDIEGDFFTVKGLKEKNINIYEFNTKNIKPNMKIILGSSFNEENNVEVKRAKELGLEIVSYEEMLGTLTKRFKSICISGCHGKTTTTALLSHIFKETVGANYLIGDGTGYANTQNKYFILESCEYKRHFLKYFPVHSVITNIDFDHADYYKNIDDLIDAYQEFANNTSEFMIICGDDNNSKQIKHNKILYYGINKDNDIIAKNINYTTEGTSFDLIIKNKFILNIETPFFGSHMVLNTLAVLSICYIENIDINLVKEKIKTFKGARRRFTETIVGTNILIDDYAHHPNEIDAVINSVKQKYPNKTLVSIFEPHTFSRTKMFYKEISESLNKSDYVYVMDIYKAREKQEDYPNITSNLIRDNINNCMNISRDEADKLIKYEDSVLLFMSPNDLEKLENDYIKLMYKNV